MNNGARVTLSLGGMVGVVFGCMYAYDIERNVRASSGLERTCSELDATLEARLAPSETRAVLGDAAESTSRTLRAELRRDCAHVQDRLAWWSWNMLRDVRLPSNTEARAALRPALTRVRADCAHANLALLVALHEAYAGDERAYLGEGSRPVEGPPTAEAHHAVTPEQLCESLAQLDPDATERPRMSAWDWASQLSAVSGTLAAAR